MSKGRQQACGGYLNREPADHWSDQVAVARWRRNLSGFRRADRLDIDVFRQAKKLLPKERCLVR
jgi:hypothetical protein